MNKKSLLIVLLLAACMPWPLKAQEKDMWDYITSFRATTGRQQNIACDGQFIYTSTYSKNPDGNPPVNSMFYKYDLDGNLIEEFDIVGCDHLRDLTYDGQYFYGGSAADGHESRLYCVDLANKAVIGYIDTSLESIRHCSYDPVNDGFWIGTSTSLIRINREGQTVQTVTGVPVTGLYCSGSGYFTDDEGEAHLFMFCNNGIYPYVYDYNITDNAFNSTAVLEFANTPGYVAYGGAGGAFVGEYNGHVCFFGDSPASPNFIAIYALGDFTPTPPEPPTGDLFYDFDDGYLEWTTIDADGDGYNWSLIRNWGNYNNPYSVASASVDDNEQPLTPDNYLVSPFKLTYDCITFWACAQDETYPAEHFGVAVATKDNPEAADFTTIQEWTLTAKTQGLWYEFTADLREYQGQEIWVAIRHFGCTDQFMIVVDDITLYRDWDGVADQTPTTMSIYPNPAADRIMVNSDDQIETYEVYSITGALVRSGIAGRKAIEIDLSDLSSGSYLLKLATENSVKTQRFIKL